MKKILLTSVVLLATLTCQAQYKLDTINYAGPSDTFTDIVFLGDGFTESEMDKFVAAVRDHADKFFDKMPWTSYRKMFNVFYIKTPSNESGAGMTPDKPIDNFYGVCFGTSGVDRMPWPTKWDKVYEVLYAVKPEYDMVPIIVNSDKYGGGGGGKFICYSMNASSIETLRHEAGHAFGNLADEYWYKGYEAANMTQNINPVKWQQWMGVEGIGTYRYDEDRTQEAYTWYRPHEDCLMRYLNREYCAVCREALIEKIHETSKNIKSYTPTEESVIQEDQALVFQLDLLKPEPNTLHTEWQLDDNMVAQNEEQLTILAGTLAEGSHTLSVSVEDTTLLVRTAGHAALHVQTITWKIDAQNATGIRNLSATESNFTITHLPFNTELVVISKQPSQQPIRMELIDASGRQVANGSYENSYYCSLATGHLPAGIYILRIYQDEQLVYVRKVTKQ